MPARNLLHAFLHSDGVKGRVLRSTVFTLAGTQGGTFLRLASNLVLTRLLAPEAFGLMAIVTVFMVGLQMISDTGLRGSVIQSAHGDDPDFLNTIWTVQVARGVLLWLAASALAVPAAALYGEPMLAQLLPVTAFSMVIRGLQTTNALSLQRHLTLGRFTWLSLGAQLIGLFVMAALAFWLRSVWALAIGTVISTAIFVAAYQVLLPGIRNRPRLERDSLREIIGFGKYIFFTSLAGFAIRNSDRAILGAYLPIAVFGVYNIGWTLAGFTTTLAMGMANKVLFPLYRTRHPLDGEGYRRAVFKARRLLIAAMLAASAVMAFLGIWLADLLFDPRYALAGPVVVVLATALVPGIVTLGTVNAALARGDSRSFFFVVTSTAVVQLVLMLLGLEVFGVLGAIASIALAPIATYPILAWVARRYANWDPLADAGFLVLGFALHGAACWVHRDAIAVLAAAGGG